MIFDRCFSHDSSGEPLVSDSEPTPVLTGFPEDHDGLVGADPAALQLKAATNAFLQSFTSLYGYSINWLAAFSTFTAAMAKPDVSPVSILAALVLAIPEIFVKVSPTYHALIAENLRQHFQAQPIKPLAA